VWLCKHGPLVDGVSLPQPRRQIPSKKFDGKQLCGAYRLPACRRRTVLVIDQFLTSS
jgi:hypothetical protein